MWFIRALEGRFICGMLSASGVFFVGTVIPGVCSFEVKENKERCFRLSSCVLCFCLCNTN